MWSVAITFGSFGFVAGILAASFYWELRNTKVGTPSTSTNSESVEIRMVHHSAGEIW